MRSATVSSAAATADDLPDRLAEMATWALIAEAELTPKPALVDGRGAGVHPDLSLEAMRRSARALEPSFKAMAEASLGRRPDRALREDLAALGRAAERPMLAATGGSNAHRGAIWVMGLMTAAIACGGVASPDHAAERAGEIARHHNRFVPAEPSHGQRAAARYGVPGARGEAHAGFPHVVRIGLPMLRASRAAGNSETHARLDALMAITASLDDTCLLHRGGLNALRTAKRGSAAVLAKGGSGAPDGWRALLDLHGALMALNASPGGAADMLAAALFLDRLMPVAEAPFPPTTEDFPWKC